MAFISRRTISSDARTNFPYKFNNTRELVNMRETTKAESLDTMNQMLTHKDFRLQDGFSMAYLSLLKSIQQNTLADIGTFCERNLYKAWVEGLEEINREIDRIEILNEDKFPKNVRMSIIDFNQTFGAHIDREENRTRVVKRFAPSLFAKKQENFDMYMPDIKAYGDKLPLNFEMLVRIETNLKLDLIDREGKSIVSEQDKKEDEVHFIRFESVVSEYDIKFGTVFKLLKELGRHPDL